MYVHVGVITVGPLCSTCYLLIPNRVPLRFSFPRTSSPFLPSPMTTDPLNHPFIHRLLGNIEYVAYIADVVYVFDRGIHGGR